MLKLPSKGDLTGKPALESVSAPIGDPASKPTIKEGGAAPTPRQPAPAKTTLARGDATPLAVSPKKDDKKAAKTYTVQRGDTLMAVSQKTLGTAKRWKEILALNKTSIGDADDLAAGTVLRIPG